MKLLIIGCALCFATLCQAQHYVWSRASSLLPAPRQLLFTSVDSGFLITSGDTNRFLRTHDAGNTWAFVNIPIDTGLRHTFKSVSFAGQFGWLAVEGKLVDGTPIRLMQTTNGGKDWSKVELDTSWHPNQILCGSGLCYLLQEIEISSNNSGRFCFTGDRGKTWTIRHRLDGVARHFVIGQPANVIVNMDYPGDPGSQGVIASRDTGLTWDLNGDPYIGKIESNTWFADEDQGTVSGWQSYRSGAAIMPGDSVKISTDFGTTWVKESLPFSTANISQAPDLDHIYLTRYDGHSYYLFRNFQISTDNVQQPQPSVKLWPCPANRKLFITAVNSNPPVILDVLGRTRTCAFSREQDSRLDVDVGSLPDGLYFLILGGRIRSFQVLHRN